jgi:hypothetical protein
VKGLKGCAQRCPGLLAEGCWVEGLEECAQRCPGLFVGGRVEMLEGCVCGGVRGCEVGPLGGECVKDCGWMSPGLFDEKGRVEGLKVCMRGGVLGTEGVEE